MKSISGKKYDSGKPNLSLLPSRAVTEIGKVLSYGEKKYGAHNWRDGIEFSRNLAAALRHTFKHLAGDTVDEESGCYHLAHACVDLMFILEYLGVRSDLDDRHAISDSLVVSRSSGITVDTLKACEACNVNVGMILVDDVGNPTCPQCKRRL